VEQYGCRITRTKFIPMNTEKICSVCEISFEENYCSRCGQKFSNTPTTTVSLISDFFSNFFSLERSGFATILKILANPKKIVNNYFSGYKNYYSSPGKILLYGIACVALHVSFVSNKVMGLSVNVQNINAQYLFWIILFPVLFFISFATFFRRERNFSKHIISITYIATSLFILLTILNDIIILTLGDLLGIWAFILFVLSVFFWNSRVFSNKQKYLTFTLNTAVQAIIFIAITGMLILKTNEMNN